MPTPLRGVPDSSRSSDQYEVFDLERIVDGSGSLYVGELARDAHGPFDRIFLIAGVPRGEMRGGHAHKEQAEYLVCVHGTVDVRLESRGEISVVTLRRIGQTLYLPARYWRELTNFSPDAVLAVLATAPFDEDDYIRDRFAFLQREAAAR